VLRCAKLLSERILPSDLNRDAPTQQRGKWLAMNTRFGELFELFNCLLRGSGGFFVSFEVRLDIKDKGETGCFVLVACVTTGLNESSLQV
jgi:hypothetical protein